MVNFVKPVEMNAKQLRRANRRMRQKRKVTYLGKKAIMNSRNVDERRATAICDSGHKVNTNNYTK